MNSLGLDLRELLDRWESGDAPGLADLAQRITHAADVALACAGDLTTAHRDSWHRWLDVTRRPRFLRALPDRVARYRWADVAARAVRASHYTLESMLAQRVAEHPNRAFLRDAAAGPSGAWSYLQVHRRLSVLAASLLQLQPPSPRVAILADNGLTAACTDLACLAFDIVVAPLSTHFDHHEIASILDQLHINIVVTDSDERHAMLAGLRSAARSFRIARTDLASTDPAGIDLSLPRVLTELDPGTAASILAHRPRLGIDDQATVMFTQSSAGGLKGIAFSQSNLVVKRFARAAALPNVGDDEVLLCFLPLFNTFGRFLELQGALFWGGTYVFAGNPSLDTLLARMPEIRPTGLISVPARWAQLRSRCAGSAPDPVQTVAHVTGGRLRWGISAAGRLEPAVFRFFHDAGVELCSGFGMTEATGGITMTPPGEYKDESLGIALPAIDIRLDAKGEMHIRGPYVARPLENQHASDWLATGDLFRIDDDGHFRITDKVKDIYKNSRGQTVAPARVEQKLQTIPGIQRAFVVGDGRDDNVALIALAPASSPGAVHGSVEQAERLVASSIAEANLALAPFERVVDFRIIGRDLSTELGELDADGTPKRKLIVEHFEDVIRPMYAQRSLLFSCGEVSVSVPRWLPRDLGILLNDFDATDHGLIDNRSGRVLLIARTRGGLVRVGDLDYAVAADTVDLGSFVRQPRLWLGNLSLTRFFPCKDGWDAKADGIGAPSLANDRPHAAGLNIGRPASSLSEVHELLGHVLLGPLPDCVAALQRIPRFLGKSPRIAEVIRHRLGLLAYHHDDEIRRRVLDVLIRDPDTADDSVELQAYVEAGLPRLDDGAVATLAAAPALPTRLDAMRRVSPLSPTASEALVAWLDALAPACPMPGIFERWAELAHDARVRDAALARCPASQDDRLSRLLVASQADPRAPSPWQATVSDGIESVADRALRLPDAASAPMAHATLWTRALAAFLQAARSLDFRFLPLPASPASVFLQGDACTGRFSIARAHALLEVSHRSHLLDALLDGFFDGAEVPGLVASSRDWLLDALMETIAPSDLDGWIRSAHDALQRRYGDEGDACFARWLARFRVDGYVPLDVRCAAEAYESWCLAHPDATPQQRADTSDDMGRRYGVSHHPLLARVHYALHTRFASADEPMRSALRRVKAALVASEAEAPHNLVETADLFAVTHSRADRIALRTLLFGG